MDLQNPTTFPNNPPIQESQTTPDHLSILSGLILILFGILIGVVAARFIPLPTNNPTPITTPTPTSVISDTPSTNADDIANWKTYTNSKYGFQVQYPNSWTLDTASLGQDIVTLQGNQGSINIDPTNKAKITLPIKSWIEKSNQQLLNNPNKQPMSSPVTIVSYDNELNISETPIAINNSFFGSDGKSFIFSHKGTIFLLTSSYYFDDGVTVGNTTTPKDIVNKRLQLVDQILSTFKFLDDTKTNSYTCPANGWVDCMPGPNAKPECSTSAMSWYKANCPNFQGGAL